MAVSILEGNHYWFSPFTVPASRTVTVDIEASGEVDIYFLINEQELNAFKSGNPPLNRGFFQKRFHYGKVNLAVMASPGMGQLTGALPFLIGSHLPVGSPWYLVIANRSQTERIAIFYRVFNA